jgi:spore photoproduct lyase
MHNRGAFVKNFPAAPGSPPCGEKYVLTVLNCIFSCSYCYLQTYLDHRNIVVYTNLARLKREIERTLVSDPPRRLTTGELGDSLALDELTRFTDELLPLFAGTGTLLELRTKSDRADHLIGRWKNVDGRSDDARTSHAVSRTPAVTEARERLLVTWTLGPEEMIRSEEHGTASLDERLEAMGRTAASGIKVAVRLDPIVPFHAEPAAYDTLAERIAGAVREDAIYRFELGVMRYPPGLWDRVRESNPSSTLLHGEYVKDSGRKLRLYRPQRIVLYRRTVESIRRRFPRVPIELSMEHRTVWEDSGLKPPAES